MKTKPLYQDILQNMGEDDLSLIRRIISNYSFIDYGIVQAYKDSRVDVKLAHQLLGKDVNLTNIEVLTSGSKAFSVQNALVKGDIVQLLSSKSLVESVAELTQATLNSTLAYSVETIKAVPLANYADAKNKLAIKDDGSFKLTGNGYTVEVTTDGTIKISGKELDLNGSGKSFVTGDELSTALATLCGKLTAHVHPSNGAPAPTLIGLACDISSAKTTTVKTGG